MPCVDTTKSRVTQSFFKHHFFNLVLIIDSYINLIYDTPNNLESLKSARTSGYRNIRTSSILLPVTNIYKSWWPGHKIMELKAA